MDRKKLENYKKEQEYRESLVRAYQRRRESINRLVASYEGERVQSSSRIEDKEAEELVKLMDLMEEEIKLLAKGTEELKLITKYLDKIDNATYRQILSMRYLEGKELLEMADELHFDYHYLCRLHGNALAEFDKLC